MRRISADYIFPIASPPVKNGIVTAGDDGSILQVSEQDGGDCERFSGVICPGFVNTHCHLELSYLKGKISERKGLPGFISEFVSQRGRSTPGEIKKAITAAEDEMLRNGIVATGDISNTDHSFEQKEKENIRYHTFVEIFDLDRQKAEESFQAGKMLREKIKGPASIVPHAPYTVSKKLFTLIDKEGQELISIHNQETGSEDEFFLSGTGVLADRMRKSGIKVEEKVTGENSLASTLRNFSSTSKILLVHNTYTSKKDMQLLTANRKLPTLFFATCPNANLYIEDKLPDYNSFIGANAKMTIGTDSCASNWSLSILDEMKTIQKHFPHISLETLFTWATRNGAECLGFQKELGTIEAGKRPGLVLVDNIDPGNMKLAERASARRII